MSALAQFAHGAESLIDRLRPKSGTGKLIVEPYIGYSTPGGALVRGRVLEAPTQNLVDHVLDHAGPVAQMLQNFLTDEVSGVDVAAAGISHQSDEEGYFSLLVPTDAVRSGFVTVTLVQTGDNFDLPVSLARPDATRGIISDIDDTLIETGAWEITRNLWTTFTTSAADRVVYDDTIALIRNREADRNPVFFVSSSPWNLHQYLLEIFKRSDAPIGPMFLRDLGVDQTKFIQNTHGSHKGDAIDTIIAANPGLEFTLIGDTGQHDARVYLDALQRHPGRINEICLRNAGKLDDLDAQAAKKIRETGVMFFSGPDFWPQVASR